MHFEAFFAHTEGHRMSVGGRWVIKSNWEKPSVGATANSESGAAEAARSNSGSGAAEAARNARTGRLSPALRRYNLYYSSEIEDILDKPKQIKLPSHKNH